MAPERRTGARRIAWWFVRIGPPLALFAVVLSVFFGEQMVVDHELSLSAPEAAQPGADVAAQALVFAGIGRVEGPRIVSRGVRVRWMREGELVHEDSLVASPAGGAAGTLRAPDRAGDYELLAIAEDSDGAAVATARAPIRIAADAPPAERGDRLARATQRLIVGPVESAAGIAPSALDVRAEGGACAPETPCALLVHVGEPAATVRLAETQSVTPETAARTETTGLVRLPFVAHGPEAVTTLEAIRGGVVVARRALRLPITLATPNLAVPPLWASGAEMLTVHTIDTRPVLVDVYRDGHWQRSSAREPAGTALEWDGPPLGPGLWRLQVRTDPFGADHAATRFVVVRGQGQPEEEAWEAAERQLEESGAPGEIPPPGSVALRAAWRLARAEESLMRLPAPVSGRAADEAAIANRQATLRGAALIAVVLGLIVIALLFVRHGVDSALEAQRIMDATGDPELMSAQHKRRLLLSTMAWVATMILAFVAAAALVIVRARLLF